MCPPLGYLGRPSLPSGAAPTGGLVDLTQPGVGPWTYEPTGDGTFQVRTTEKLVAGDHMGIHVRDEAAAIAVVAAQNWASAQRHARR